MKFTNALNGCNSLWTALVPKKMGFRVKSAKSETGRGSNRIV
jgi:hypothetical protein